MCLHRKLLLSLLTVAVSGYAQQPQMEDVRLALEDSARRVMDLPVGPLLQKTAESIFKKHRNNGPIIMPSTR